MSIADFSAPEDNYRILIVDDDRDFTDALRELLEATGFIDSVGDRQIVPSIILFRRNGAIGIAGDGCTGGG